MPRRFGLRTLRRVAALGVAWVSCPDPAQAQGVRGWVATTVQAVGLRGFGVDTLPFADALPGPGGSYTVDGRAVACVVELFCTRYRAEAPHLTWVGTQDVSLTAWGLGVTGLSATTYMRVRARHGDGLVWPRSDDRFDALLAYLQWVRGPVRVRAGRQEVRTGLGFPAFDGFSGTWSAGRLLLEAYGGRSLARGLREPANEALRGVEAFLLDESAWLVGVGAALRVEGVDARARYHREIHADRSGLVSERASLDVVAPVRGGRLLASVDYDLAFGHMGKSHLTLALPLVGRTWSVEASARRYQPYFEMSTIWGFFQPVPYHEADVRVGWSPSASVAVWGGGGYRRYGDAEATVVFRPLEDHGWRGHATARWAPSPAWTWLASYRVEWGPGAFLTSGDLSATARPADRLRVTATATTFQQIEEFRVGDGRAWGGGLSADWTVSERLALTAGGSLLRHRDGGSPFTSPWSQSRAWTTARVAIGSEPGLSRRGSR